MLSKSQKEWIISLTLGCILGGLGSIMILYLIFKFHDWLWLKLAG